MHTLPGSVASSARVKGLLPLRVKPVRPSTMLHQATKSHHCSTACTGARVTSHGVDAQQVQGFVENQGCKKSLPLVLDHSRRDTYSAFLTRTAFIGSREISTYQRRSSLDDSSALMRRPESTIQLHSSRFCTDRQTAQGRTWRRWRCTCFSTRCFGDSGSRRASGLSYEE